MCIRDSLNRNILHIFGESFKPLKHNEIKCKIERKNVSTNIFNYLFVPIHYLTIIKIIGMFMNERYNNILSAMFTSQDKLSAFVWWFCNWFELESKNDKKIELYLLVLSLPFFNNIIWNRKIKNVKNIFIFEI